MILECEHCENWTRIPDVDTQEKLALEIHKKNWTAGFVPMILIDEEDPEKGWSEGEYASMILCEKCASDLKMIYARRGDCALFYAYPTHGQFIKIKRVKNE